MWLEGVIGIPANKTTGRSAVVVHYILKAYDNDTVTIAYEDDTEQVFNKSDIALIRLALDF